MIKITQELINVVMALAKKAGEAILTYYHVEMEATYKADGSPLHQADLMAHRIIADGLSRLSSDVIVVSEESENLEDITINNAKQFWLVDPLDGTKEFIKRNNEFTVNIALIDSGIAVLGVVYAPALNVLYLGSPFGALKIDALGQHAIRVSSPLDEGIQVVASRSHANATELSHFLSDHVVAGFFEVGSSLKFCQVAEGHAHLYPRLGRTMEWDTAAGQAVLVAAGGLVEALDGLPLHYGKPGFENPHFIARTDNKFVC